MDTDEDAEDSVAAAADKTVSHDHDMIIGAAVTAAAAAVTAAAAAGMNSSMEDNLHDGNL